MLVEYLKYNLEKSGFPTVVTSSLKKSVRLLKKHDFDLIILDCVMPGEDVKGYIDFVRRKSEYGPLPVIVVYTLHDDIRNEILAFDWGADDFISKRNTPRLLIMRIGAHHKRSMRIINFANDHGRKQTS